MTSNQFDVLAKLMRGNRDSLTNKAAYLVLVKGLSQTEATKMMGVTKQGVSSAVLRYSAAHKLVKAAYTSE